MCDGPLTICDRNVLSAIINMNESSCHVINFLTTCKCVTEEAESKFMVQAIMKFSGPEKPIIVVITRAMYVQVS